MRYGEIYSYRNAKEAKKYIGKKGMFSDSLRDILDLPAACDVLILMDIKEGETYPFYGEPEEEVFQFFRPVLSEDDELMTNRQIVEWLMKGNGEYCAKDGSLVDTHFGYGKSKENFPVPDQYLIRRWNDTEWVKPTKEIYEEDCKIW